MKEEKEISIEDHGFGVNDDFWIEYFEENDFKTFRCKSEIFEAWVVENNLLDWHDVKKRYDGEPEEREGKWDFTTWTKEKLNLHIVKRFLISELQKMKDA